MGKWKVHWYVWITDGEGNEERKHRSRVIGRKPPRGQMQLSASDADLPVMTRAEAQAELDRIIRVEVGDPETRRSGATLFGEFWRERWLPLHRDTWRENTRNTIMAVLESQIDPRWGATRLDLIDATAAAAWLGKLAAEYSPSICHKARTYFRAIMAEAVEQGYLIKDPVRKLRKPQPRLKVDRSYLSAEEVQALRKAMHGFRDRLILDILLATGMRPSELFALRWSDISDTGLMIDEAFVKGWMNEPKTASSIAAVSVPAEIMGRLEQFRRESNPTDPQSIIFPSEAGTPIYSENWRKRVLYPAARAAKVRVNFQILRRTLATLALQSGVPVKAVQAQLRHSSADVTMNVYAQIVTAEQARAAETMFGIMTAKKADVA